MLRSAKQKMFMQAAAAGVEFTQQARTTVSKACRCLQRASSKDMSYAHVVLAYKAALQR